ncbi:Fosfomycin resistance protein AbaF [Paraburkholderia kirstenboschensis]|uniref:MFS transporter n=1 Tax=Paraburkholderia kirstenboschensis TaxID=1245436 RepID=UPI000A630308|nr:MFS transporter [Paraburkholderia kirstenboschensis]CAD6558163.1 Fosfomycin resistance protein AbaF [Paraburkholderia kirstenboschensis]
MASTASTARQKRLIIASTFIGSTIEWYDFFIFGTVSALFLNKLFFPAVDPTMGTIFGFMTFATAWLVRPIGGVVAGHLGDRIGRKTTLLWSFIIMGAATTLIGLLPTYESAGYVGAVLLVLLRVVQGLSAGAEYGGAIVTVVEHADESRRGLFGSVPQSAAFFGLLLGNLTFLAMTMLDKQALMNWGWRVPFVLSAAMLMVGIYIRNRVAESPAFVKAKAAGNIEKLPVMTVLREFPQQLLGVLFAQAAPNTFFYTCAVAMVSYAVSKLKMNQADMLIAVSVGAAVEMLMIPVYGILSDRIGGRKVFVWGIAALLIGAIPFCLAVEARSYAGMVAGYVWVLGVGHAACHSSQASLFSDMFPTSVRYTGISAGYQMSGAIFGGPLPIVATVLIAYQNGGIRLFFGYAMLIGLVSLIAIMASKPHYSLVGSDGDQPGRKHQINTAP